LEYIFLESNIGSHQLMIPIRVPFAILERAVLAELHRHFRPGLIGRFDEKIVFRPLTPETQREIALIVIGEEIERYRRMGIDLTIDEETVEMLIRKGITKALGARPMKRTVQKFLGDVVRERMKKSRNAILNQWGG
jgi:ATP-dependent Clp protease ATP-binding subunit ClpA